VVSVIMVIVTALAAAVLYGAGAAVQQRQAAAAPQSAAGRPRLLFLPARQPLWLLGIVVQIAGFAAHVAAWTCPRSPVTDAGNSGLRPDRNRRWATAINTCL
jgi:hypothetical protein